MPTRIKSQPSGRPARHTPPISSPLTGATVRPRLKVERESPDDSIHLVIASESYCSTRGATG